jgi:uncharacterized protein YdiU (UPF0061 family)
MSRVTQSKNIENIDFAFDNSYARLPERFFQRISPVPVKMPDLIYLNNSLSDKLGLNTDFLAGDTGAAIFSGNSVPSGADPIALAYSGHQFGNFVPQLGDGRAVLLGEVLDANGKRWDIQLKGSGRTAFSRNGDGRAALGPVIREYIISEAMHRLGISTNRSLALVTTGENVHREHDVPGAILTRLASSHVRVGTFEFFAARRDIEALQLLADYTIDRLYPELKGEANRYFKLIERVVEVQASLIASWMHVGFIHGVMNTDNMTISGETIDYGPCAFMDNYDPMAVFSSIDQFGRYAYKNQSKIGQWNLASLSECLLPLLGEDQEKSLAMVKEVIAGFDDKFSNYWLDGMREKLGLITLRSSDHNIVQGLLDLMQKHRVDFTLVFRRLCDAADKKVNTEELAQTFSGDSLWSDWLASWLQRLGEEPRAPRDTVKAMRDVNPLFIPRNHLVEQAIYLAVDKNDFSEVETLLKLTASPYSDDPAFSKYSEPPRPEERVFQTFCGT